MRPDRRRKLYAIASLLGASVVVLVLAELALRVVAADAHHVWRPGQERVFHPHPGALPGISGPGRFRINGQGMRGDGFTADDTLRILAVGGSTTEALYLDQDEAWPQLLQQELNRRLGPESRVRVGNVGKSGLTTRHHVLQVERLLDQHEGIDVVLVLAGANDLLKRLARDDGWRPLPPPARWSTKSAATLTRQAFAVHPGWDAGFPFFKRTELWRRARALAARRFASASGVVQDDAGRVFVKLRRHRREAVGIRHSLPDLSPALQEFSDNIGAIVESARRRGAVPILLTQPSMWSGDLEGVLRDLLWCGGVGNYFGGERADYYAIEALAAGMARYNEQLLATCASLEARCLDLASALPRDATVFYDDLHFNESGSRRVALFLGDRLLDTVQSHPPRTR